jgi:phosphate transporter
LDREKQKVEEFYRHKEDELHHALDLLEDEVAAIEERDLGTDDIIKEEDEDDDDEDEDDEGVRHSRSGNERSPLINSTTSNAPRAPSRPRRSKSSILRRFGNFAGRRRSAINTTHEADILEASFAPSIDRARSSSTSQGMGASVSTLDTPSLEEPGPISPNVFSPIHRANSSKRPNGPRTTSDFDLEDSAVVGHGRDRRTSGSSISSHEQDVWQARRKHLSLGLVQMDPTSIPPIIAMSRYHQNQNENAEDESGEMEQRPVYVWTANNDYGTVLRIGFKKRISAVWLEAYALKQYVDLNLTAFEKILKK